LFVLSLPGCSNADRQDNTDRSAEATRESASATTDGGVRGAGAETPPAPETQ
jgi:hypothetical protein